jgi:hypothetical protein
MIANWRRVVSLYDLRPLMFNTGLPTASRTLNIPENLISVEIFNENFKAKIGEIKEIFHVDWLICFSQVNSIDF